MFAAKSVAVKKTDSLQTQIAMNLKDIEKKLEHFNFPVLPQMLVQVKQVTADETAGAQDLAEIILKDQSLTTKILHNPALACPHVL